MEDELGYDTNLPIFQKFAFILNECKPKKAGDAVNVNASVNPLSARPDSAVDAEPFITKIGRLLVAKLKAHGREAAELFGPDEVLRNKSASLIPVMYRIATESFIKESKSNFKIIECRNVTKLASDWKPSLPDLLNSLGHQVIIVELKESLNFQTYNDFVYAVLRQLNYDWKIRLPRSFFYPDDVCEVDASDDHKLLVITPKMPDGKFEFSDRVKNSLQYDILLMLKRSCESAMHNHLLMRDLRVGKFCDAVDGVESIRTVYRNLQERISSGEEVCLGQSTEDIKLYLSTSAGSLIQSAEAFLHDCKSFDDESWATFNESDEGNELIILKPAESDSSVDSEASSIDVSTFREAFLEEDYTIINSILSDLKTMTKMEPNLETYDLPGKKEEVNV